MAPPRRGLLASALLAVLSFLLFVGINLWTPLPRANSQSNVVPPGVRDRVLRAGQTRIIAELRLPNAHVPEGLLTLAGQSVQRQDIANARLQVLGRLAGRSHTVLRQYSTVPLVALDVGPDALTELEAAGIWVKRVVLDTLNAPSLPQSVPLIGADQAWSRGYDGTGVMVAIIDTGVEVTHPFLAGKVLEEACYSSTVAGHSVTMCPNGSTQQTGPGAGVSCPLSVCWHGTHVAGIAAGNGLGAGVGFSGVAKGAQIMSVMVFSKFTNSTDCGGSAPCALAWTSDIIAGLERVYALSGTRNLSSANLSLGDSSPNTVPCDGDPTKSIIDNLRSVGIATAIAAGNNGFTNALSAPACISSAVSVGATTKSDVIASYSNIASFLSLLAPGGGLGAPPAPIYSSVTGGAFGYASGTSMAAPHVTGAWAVLRQAAPSASVGQILSALQSTGVPVSETSGGVTITKPRIQVNLALGALVPTVSAVAPNQGAPGATVPVTITGTGFITGATVSVSGTGVTASNVTVGSATQITTTLTIASNAATGARDVTVTNPGGGSGTLTGGFTVTSASPATLTLVYNGPLRDRVGQGDTALGPDGALDGTLTATLRATGGRTITALRLDSSGPGTWDTIGGNTFWVLGVATSLDGALLNAPGTMAVNFPVADGGSFVVFAADYQNMEFVSGRTLTLTATFSDGSTAVASTTVAASAATLTLAYNGMLRDRVGQGDTALGPDGALDGTLTATLKASGGRTITALRLDSSVPGTWDTTGGNIFFVLGVATTLDGPLLNAPGTMAVNFPVADGGSFVVFAADYQNMEFVSGRTLTLTATFSDGSTAVASTTVAASAATLTLAYNGMLRDRVGQGDTALGPDGALDGTLTATLRATGGRTITALRLDSSGPGTWDTIGGNIFWVLGVATSLDGALLNAPGTMAVNFPVADGGSFVVFAADYQGIEFVTGRTLTLTATFSDGSTAVASTTIAAAATLALAYNGLLRDRVGQGDTALGPDGALDGTLTATLKATGGRTITALRLDSSGPGTWDTTGGNIFFVLGVATTLDGPLLNVPATMAVNFPVADGGSFVVFAADYLNMEFLSGRTLTLTATFSDGSTAVASTVAP